MEKDDEEYLLAGPIVSGLQVASEVPNTGSISASLNEWEELRGIREVPLSDFDAAPSDLFYDKRDLLRVKKLAETIRESGWISPLIVVIDDEGPYILEGAHRLGALYTLGVPTFPALVVQDES